METLGFFLGYNSESIGIVSKIHFSEIVSDSSGNHHRYVLYFYNKVLMEQSGKSAQNAKILIIYVARTAASYEMMIGFRT